MIIRLRAEPKSHTADTMLDKDGNPIEAQEEK